MFMNKRIDFPPQPTQQIKINTLKFFSVSKTLSFSTLFSVILAAINFGLLDALVGVISLE